MILILKMIRTKSCSVNKIYDRIWRNVFKIEQQEFMDCLHLHESKGTKGNGGKHFAVNYHADFAETN